MARPPRPGPTLRLAALALVGVVLGGCHSGPAASGPVTTPAASTPVVTVSTAPSATSRTRDEAIVRRLVMGGTDRFGWVRAPAKSLLTTYFAPGQRYLGGESVAPSDQILVVKMHGAFDHSVQAGANSTASLALVFYNASAGRAIGFFQMWDGDAPDLGIGSDPGIADRDGASRRWDLRLVGTPDVRTP